MPIDHQRPPRRITRRKGIAPPKRRGERRPRRDGPNRQARPARQEDADPWPASKCPWGALGGLLVRLGLLRNQAARVGKGEKVDKTPPPKQGSQSSSSREEEARPVGFALSRSRRTVVPCRVYGCVVPRALWPFLPRPRAVLLSAFSQPSIGIDWMWIVGARRRRARPRGRRSSGQAPNNHDEEAKLHHHRQSMIPAAAARHGQPGGARARRHEGAAVAVAGASPSTRSGTRHPAGHAFAGFEWPAPPIPAAAVAAAASGPPD